MQTILKVHKDEIDELFDSYEGDADELSLMMYISEVEGVDVYEVYWCDEEGYIVTDKMTIEYKDFKK